MNQTYSVPLSIGDVPHLCRHGTATLGCEMMANSACAHRCVRENGWYASAGGTGSAEMRIPHD